MVDKIDHLYAMLDDLDDDLSAMQEDLEAAIELIEEGDTSKAKIILEEMSAFLADFLEPEECDDEECECYIIEEGEELLEEEDASYPFRGGANLGLPVAAAPSPKAPAKKPAKKKK